MKIITLLFLFTAIGLPSSFSSGRGNQPSKWTRQAGPEYVNGDDGADEEDEDEYADDDDDTGKRRVRMNRFRRGHDHLPVRAPGSFSPSGNPAHAGPSAQPGGSPVNTPAVQPKAFKPKGGPPPVPKGGGGLTSKPSSPPGGPSNLTAP